MSRILETLDRWATALARWYDGGVRQQRRAVEEDARRLGGHVTWEDVQ
jgi:hypothetical protein